MIPRLLLIGLLAGACTPPTPSAPWVPGTDLQANGVVIEQKMSGSVTCYFLMNNNRFAYGDGLICLELSR